jgi:HTH-type transcriptional regulator, competence development regulator
MKIERSREWWLKRAREEDISLGAGSLALGPAPEDARIKTATVPAEETRIVFGIFVKLMRRRLSLTMEKLAQVADIDARELLIIEDDVRYVPGPRTVYQLATAFKVPQRSLMKLAGLSASNDDVFRQEAVRFAARSEAVQRLTPEENAALEAFVAVLSNQEPKHVK